MGRHLRTSSQYARANRDLLRYDENPGYVEPEEQPQDEYDSSSDEEHTHIGADREATIEDLIENQIEEPVEDQETEDLAKLLGRRDTHLFPAIATPRLAHDQTENQVREPMPAAPRNPEAMINIGNPFYCDLDALFAPAVSQATFQISLQALTDQSVR